MLEISIIIGSAWHRIDSAIVCVFNYCTNFDWVSYNYNALYGYNAIDMHLHWYNAMNICSGPGLVELELFFEQTQSSWQLVLFHLLSPRKRKQNKINNVTPKATLNQAMDWYCSLENITETPAEWVLRSIMSDWNWYQQSSCRSIGFWMLLLILGPTTNPTLYPIE